MIKRKQTACGLYHKVCQRTNNGRWGYFSRLDEAEAQEEASQLFEDITEMHAMCERMEARLHEYLDFVEDIANAAVDAENLEELYDTIMDLVDDIKRK